MTTAEERLRILQLIQEGKVTAEEGARLLEALGTNQQDDAGQSHQRRTMRDSRVLRVRITDLDTGKTKVNVNVPMSLVNVGVKLGARFMPSHADIDFDELMEAIHEGASGQLVNVEDVDSGEQVEVWVE